MAERQTNTRQPSAFGWQRDLPDVRDYTDESPAVASLLRKLPANPRHDSSHVDLREFFPPVYDQGNLPSTTSQACIGLVAYFERRCHGRLVTPSRLFHYQVMCDPLAGSTQLDLRTGFKALVRFGLPPERYWPYDESRVDHPPKPQLFAFTEPHRRTVYFRLDRRDESASRTLARVKAFLASNFPVAFGLAFPSSCAANGVFFYRPLLDDVPLGGQALVAVGYDDSYLSASRGALLVRNSWGTSWGERGYGWLPYEYVTEGLAIDFWTIIRKDWAKADELYRPRSRPA